MQSDFAVECLGIKKSYYQNDLETPALRGIDLKIKSGELYMLVGPSGCGKTTLISVIAGILLQDQGQCLVFGENLAQLNNKQRTIFRGKNIGFVFQAYNLIPSLTSAENVAVPLLLNNYSRSEAVEMASDLLVKVGLAKYLKTKPSQLSGGQQQRVAIARSLIHKPKLIVCDEPTSALDYENGIKIMQIFRELVLEQNRALIIVTHDNRIFPYADRIAKMNDGIVEKIVPPKELEKG